MGEKRLDVIRPMDAHETAQAWAQALRHSDRPKDSVIVLGDDGRLQAVPLDAATQSAPGLIVYRFSASLYYANSELFNEELLGLVEAADPPIECIVLDASAVSNIDFSGAATLRQAIDELSDRGVRLVLADVADHVKTQLDRYGMTEVIGVDGFADSIADAVSAFRT